MTGQAAGLESEVGAVQGSVPPLERPHFPRSDERRCVTLPAVERRVRPFRLPADFRMLELRGLPAHKVEVTSEVLLVAARAVTGGVGRRMVSGVRLDPTAQRGVALQAEIRLDPLCPQLVAVGARTDPSSSAWGSESFPGEMSCPSAGRASGPRANNITATVANIASEPSSSPCRARTVPNLSPLQHRHLARNAAAPDVQRFA